MATTSEKMQQQFPNLKWNKLPSPEEHSNYTWHGFEPNSKLFLERGHTRWAGRLPFPVDTILERDVAVPIRDGIRIYADVFRPANTDAKDKVPAVIAFSPYGKTGTGVPNYDIMGPHHIGLKLEDTSGYEKFEGPDPATWAEYGYAIINVDARGAGKSEGNVVFYGPQEAEDVYDTIDYISKQPWCSGSVGMAGNSWLAISQINFASRHEHPALKALAPWEGRHDVYRDTLGRGGRRHNPYLHRFLLSGFTGTNAVENMPEMFSERPFYDDYWESKYIHTENINVPIYLLGSFPSQLHIRGSFHIFRTAKTSQKWLRVHPNADLKKFYDRFLKGIQNGWEEDTPPVRLSLLGFEADGNLTKSIEEQPEREWPLARQQLKTLYLNSASKELVWDKQATEGSITHFAEGLTDKFYVHFKQHTEIAGYAKVKLWISCKEHDDLDVAVQLRKISADGRLLEHLNYPCPLPVSEVRNDNIAKCLGPQGFLRASHRVTKDDKLSTAQEVVYKHDKREPIPLGEVVNLEITLWPMGMVFAPGEGIMLRVAGYDMCYPDTDRVKPAHDNNENVGHHTIHTGGKYDSQLILPFI
ncbi:hypothetical protein TRIATDRAFT_266016 [Trichoderma atroviride IMI 206040]|uniref:Xaa-Pro dipeptidyl-peptidase C-terminal domain-containing protein n=1 Tax=Hypocrea atroviridis (strain ATCC 20476 / IMI 206040) TaxID=452589 RepID=G9NYG8_HYPAI|nr:uncharacterized protein TRIATDRAFT_266016 [Trichoderma atroviride IMI 206040]EHK44480.1 hypothetical protein TRIATDRAFT_266016 [Trichoderma atroviride IMI 206040]